MEVIKKNPGINFREIMRNTNLKNGILSHYLNKLEKNGSVKIKTDHNKKRFYDLNISENEFKIISALDHLIQSDSSTKMWLKLIWLWFLPKFENLILHFQLELVIDL